MKCPECGAWASVLETRTRLTGVVVRRYVCANNHRFTTTETPVVVDLMVRSPGRPVRQISKELL